MARVSLSNFSGAAFLGAIQEAGRERDAELAKQPVRHSTRQVHRDLTEAQSLMLGRLDREVVRTNRNRDKWVIDGKLATSAESRVINALQAKGLTKWVKHELTITGLNGTKPILRLVRK